MSYDTFEAAFDCACQITERSPSRALRLSQSTFGLREVAAGQSVLQKFAQRHHAPQSRTGRHELGSALLLFGVLRPRHLHLRHSMFSTTHPQDPRSQIGAMLPVILVTPLFTNRVAQRAELPATRTGKPSPRGEVQRQPQLPLLHVHLAFIHFALSTQSKSLAKKCIGIHRGHAGRPEHRLLAAH